MRTITHIIVHCSANKAGSALRMADIDRIHRTQNGWNGCGYHYVIPTDGTIECGRPEQLPGAHCRGHNRHSIGVCYIGRRALALLIRQLRTRYPQARVVGHQDMDPRKPQCPGFSVAEEYEDPLGPPV